METERTPTQELSRAEILSALADDEALDNLDHLLTDFNRGDPLRWSEYHLIGDALRTIDFTESEGKAHAFLARFSNRLAQEPPLHPPVSSYQRWLQRLHRLRCFLFPATVLAAVPAMLAWMMALHLHKIETVSNPLQQTSTMAKHVGQHRLSTLTPLSSGTTVPQENKVSCKEFVPYLEAHQQFSSNPVMGAALTYIRTTAHL